MERPRLYCVFDRKSERYFPPFVVENDAVAERRFADILVDPQSVLSKHPQDYILYGVGEFDESTGECAPFEKGKVIVSQGFADEGRPHDVAVAEEEGMRKFGQWLAARGLPAGRDGR